MKIIKRLTDADIIGAGGMSDAKPRRTARVILKNNNGRYALVYSAGFNMYCFPGGGIEDNEDILTALKRELMEETGCSCDAVEELGIIEENRAHCDYTQYRHTVCFWPRLSQILSERTEPRLAGTLLKKP